MCEIQRRKISASPVSVTTPVIVSAAVTPMKKQMISPSNSGEEQVVSTNSSPTTVPADLIDENERLRKENVQLIKELSEIKSLCNNIFALMSNFANNNNQPVIAGKPLELLPAKRLAEEQAEMETETSAKLFGVAICGGVHAKRARESDDDDTELRLHLQQPDPDAVNAKSEPLDCQSNADDRRAVWLKYSHWDNRNQRVCN